VWAGVSFYTARIVQCPGLAGKNSFDTLGQIIAGNSHVPFVCARNGKTYDRKGNNQARKGGLQPEPVVPVAATRKVAENESAPDGG
jgi:hypothetical protein